MRCFLRGNSERVLKAFMDAGIPICICATNADWLTYSDDSELTFRVHGYKFGYSPDIEREYTKEMFLSDSSGDIDCGVDDGMFINLCVNNFKNEK